MCLFPKYIKNPRYRVNKGKYDFGAIDDWRKAWVPVGCGECLECRKQKAQGWRVRLLEEMKVQKNKYFVTLTFNNESLSKLCKEQDTTECNAIATIAVRRFLERIRKKYKHSIKHWLITELGHENTERIHLHGVIFTDFPINNEWLQKFWKYGKTDIGRFCNDMTINYIVKYVTKIDKEHKNYKAIILCSRGIGKSFIETSTAKRTYKYKKGRSAEYYELQNGRRVALPIYYRNKLYSDKERQNLWTDRLDKGEIYVNGIRIRNINSEKSQKYYYKLLEEQQRQNTELGYGSPTKEWQKEDYNITFKMLQRRQKDKKGI